jgi:hypothetical protein
MRIILTYVFSIGIFLYLVDVFFTEVVIFNNNISNAYKINRLISDENPAEIPIFGSSKAYRDYFPDSLGSNFYNYGMDAASMEVVNLLLSFEVKKDKDTPIIIDFHPGMFSHNPYTNVNLRYYVPLIEHEKIKRFLKDNGVYKYYHEIFGMRYFGYYYDYLIEYFSQHYQNRKLYAKGGSFEINITPKQKLKKLLDKRLHAIPSFEHNKKLADQLEGMIKEHADRTFLFVESPFHGAAYSKLENYEGMDEYLQHLAKYDNVEVLRFDGRDYEDIHFQDGGHMNLNGAKLFSSQLKNKLKNLGILTKKI